MIRDGLMDLFGFLDPSVCEGRGPRASVDNVQESSLGPADMGRTFFCWGERGRVGGFGEETRLFLSAETIVRFARKPRSIVRSRPLGDGGRDCGHSDTKNGVEIGRVAVYILAPCRPSLFPPQIQASDPQPRPVPCYIMKKNEVVYSILEIPGRLRQAPGGTVGRLPEAICVPTQRSARPNQAWPPKLTFAQLYSYLFSPDKQPKENIFCCNASVK